jgi:hypothetical protein
MPIAIAEERARIFPINAVVLRVNPPQLMIVTPDKVKIIPKITLMLNLSFHRKYDKMATNTG